MTKRRIEGLQPLVVGVVALLVWLLPLMMGHRTPETLAATGAVLGLGGLVLAIAGWGLGGLSVPPRGWWLFALAMVVVVLLQVVPMPLLARWLGPYPEALWAHGDFDPRTWSPNPHASLRGLAVFLALFTVARVMASLPRRRRAWVWLAVVVMAWFQAVYGLINHAAGSETIFGIWERHNPDYVHGSYSNRNLYAAFLALTWPLAVTVWWMRDVPLLSRLPRELAAGGSILSGAVIGIAILGSASRLGAAAGVFSMVLALVLWSRHREVVRGVAVWPLYVAVAGVLVGATWYGLMPLAERFLEAGYAGRLEVWGIMLSEFPPGWWLHGVGLGGFEAVFRGFQPGDLTGWYDYAHNDLLQWLVEMGLPGLVLLGWVLVAVIRSARLSIERIPLYAGLAAIGMVGLGDFSWHIPGTQVVIAAMIGGVLGGRRRVKGERDQMKRRNDA